MSEPAPIVGVPVARTPLFGREVELRDLEAQLSSPHVRLLTLTGPGGIGKTRLAIAAITKARTAGTRTWIVPLSGIREAERVPSAVLSAFGLRESRERSEAELIRDFLDGEPAVILLDNMEQVIEAGLFASSLLATVSSLKLLVTSRTPLQLTGETEFPVGPLAVPRETGVDDLNPAMALFAERARTVRPDFTLNEGNFAAVREICLRLDGLPLAIELAAARLKVLSPSAILSRLSYSLQLLTGGPRDAPQRLQSMRDAIQWSYELLGAEEQRFFRALGVFHSSFSLAAAQEVAGNPDSRVEPLDQILALVNQSLLVPVQGVEDEPRFAMFETIREFAAEQLETAGERDAIQARHADWLFEAVRRVSADFYTAREVQAMESIERDATNVVAAFDWLMQHDVERAGELAHLDWYYWGVRGHYREGLEWLDKVRARRLELSPLVRARVDLASAFLNWALGRYDVARPAADLALEEFERGGHTVDAGIAHICRGSVERDRGNLGLARQEFEQALEIFDSSRQPAWAAYALSFLGSLARRQGRLEDALELLERGFAITKRIDYPSGMSPIVDHLGDIARERGDYQRAYEYYQQSMPHWLKIRDPHAGADSLLGGAEALMRLGHKDQAVRMLGAAVAAYEASGMARSRYGPAYREEAIDELRSELGEERFDALWREGQRKGWEAIGRATLRLALELKQPVPPAASLTEFGLTPREIQIIDLLIEGRSNAEIGDALYISPRTAGTHVANVFSKLGVNSRSAAVGVAMRAREARA